MPRDTIRAVVFDIGGVLERVEGSKAWLGKGRLGLTEADSARPDGGTAPA